MAVVSTKGLKIWLQKAAAVAANLEPTAITDAAPPVITVASTAGMANGDVVTFSDTGFPELDGKTGIVGALTGTTFTAIGLDTTGSAGVLGPDPVASYFAADDLCNLCLSAIDIGDNAPSPVSVATFCNPVASVPGNPQPATIGFSGYIDVSDPCYGEMLAAVADGLPRVLKIDFPGSNGYLVTTVIVGSKNYAIPLEGSAAYTFTSTQTTELEHLF